jgi:hypothetical protein
LPDTLDSIDVIQLNLRQRWQTKRGFPGNQHIIDWMTLDIGTSIFPHSKRDNFGQRFGIIDYDWVWNVGDRTGLTSNGWFETVAGGPRVFNFGVVSNRFDGMNFYLGYRHLDPLNSRAVVTSTTYQFSSKYAVTGSSIYDFGTRIQSNSIILTRFGTDLQISLGVSFNSVLDSFGVTFEVLPTLLARNRGFNPGLGPLMSSGRN